MSHGDVTSSRGGAALTLLTLTAAVVATSAHAQNAPALSCDVAAFSRLALPATRIVSASAVTDDARAGPHCVVRGANPTTHLHAATPC